MAEDRRLELRVSDEWLARLDAVRGDVRRGTFVKRALEQALGEVASESRSATRVGGAKDSLGGPAASPAPVRAPVEVTPLPKIAPRRSPVDEAWEKHG